MNIMNAGKKGKPNVVTLSLGGSVTGLLERLRPSRKTKKVMAGFGNGGNFQLKVTESEYIQK